MVVEGEPLYVVVVRAGKDRDAVEATLSRFYEGWPVRAVSLGGVRGVEAIVEGIEEVLNEHGNAFVLFLGGREERSAVEEASRVINDERFAAVLVDKKRVRNARLEEIHWGIERARASLRLRIGADNDYILVHRVGTDKLLPCLEHEQPYADVFVATRGWLRWLKKLGCRVEEPVILERLAGGVHLVYSRGSPACQLLIPDIGAPSTARAACRRLPQPAKRIDYVIAGKVAGTHESLSLSLLRRARVTAEERGGVDAVVVPWSGGKDSTIALHLARMVFRDVIAVYVDTGVDFPQTREYVEEMAERLGVELITVYAGVREALRTREPPSHDNRWCTGLKLEALSTTLRRLGERLIVVTGDRDAESEARSRRPPLRWEREEGQERLIVSPLKQWSTLLLQLYAQIKGIRLNPLYDAGFYRLGCYICPALRSWERMLLLRDPLVAAPLLGRPYYRLGWPLRQG